MKIKIMLFIVVLMLSLQATTAYGMGVGVSPGNMSFKLAPGTSAEQTMYVINTGNETAKYDVFLNESAYQNWFSFSPSSFDLKAGEIKEVKVTLKVPASAETDVKCKINIPCTVPGRIVGAGVIIPVQVKLSTLEESSSEGVPPGGSSSKGVSSGGNSFKEVSSDSNSSKGVSSGGNSSKGVSSGSSSSEKIENSSNPLAEIEIKENLKQSLEKNIEDKLNFTQNITPIDEKLKYYAQKENFLNLLTELKVKDTLHQFLVRNIYSIFNFMQNITNNITNVCEKLKDYAEHLQVIGTKIIGNAIRSFDGTVKGLDDTIKNLGEKNPSALAKIEKL